MADGTSEGYVGDGNRTNDRMSIGSVRTSINMYREQLKTISGGQALQYIDILLERALELEEHIESCGCGKVVEEVKEEKPPISIDPLRVMKMAVLVSDSVIKNAREKGLLNDLELTALELVLDMTKGNLSQDRGEVW